VRLQQTGSIIIVTGKNNIRGNFKEGPLGHKKERYQYKKVTQLEVMQDLTSGGGFSLLNGRHIAGPVSQLHVKHQLNHSSHLIGG
jgi:uncharacterized protein (DUF779 family)